MNKKRIITNANKTILDLKHKIILLEKLVDSLKKNKFITRKEIGL